MALTQFQRMSVAVATLAEQIDSMSVTPELIEKLRKVHREDRTNLILIAAIAQLVEDKG